MEISYPLVTNWILNFLDFALLYIVTNSLLGYRSSEAFKRISLRIASLAIAYGLAMGTLGNFVDIRIHNAIVTIAMLGVIYLVIKKIAYISFPDKVLIVVFHHIISHTLAIPMFLIVYPLNLEAIPRNLLIYLCLVGIIFLLCLKIDLNKLFIFVTRKVLIKLVFFSLTLLFVFSVVAFNFNISYILEYGILVIVLATIAANCLYLTLKSAHEYMEIMPNTYHDTKELLAILNNKLEDINDVEEMKSVYKKVMSLMELKVISDANPNHENEFESFILKTIESIKADNVSQVPIVTEIDYYEPHSIIDDVEIAYMLGILFKNAIETMTVKPILVDVMSSEYSVLIRVANEAKHKSKEELEAMLMRNYSTKKSVGRGFGLVKLKKLVEKKNGKLSIFQEFNHQEQLNYLSVMIRF